MLNEPLAVALWTLVQTLGLLIRVCADLLAITKGILLVIGGKLYRGKFGHLPPPSKVAHRKPNTHPANLLSYKSISDLHRAVSVGQTFPRIKFPPPITNKIL